MKLFKAKEFGASVEIEGKLPKHGINDILIDCSESYPLCSIMQMTESEVLFLTRCIFC
jgi:hypothetical protein